MNKIIAIVIMSMLFFMTSASACNDEFNEGYNDGLINGHHDGFSGLLPQYNQGNYNNPYDCNPEYRRYYNGYIVGYSLGYSNGVDQIVVDAQQACNDAGYVYGYSFGIVNNLFPTIENFEFPEDCNYPLYFQEGAWDGYNDGINAFNEVIEVEEVDNGPDRTLSSPYLGVNCADTWRGYEKGDTIPELYTYWTTVEGTDFEVSFTMPLRGTYVGGVHVTPARVMGESLVSPTDLDQTALALRIAQWQANHA